MNNFSNAELHDLIPLHALGALEPDEVLLLEAYLVLNPEAQANYVWYLEAVAVLARSVPLLEPAQGLKARMLDRVRQVNAGPVCLARVDPGRTNLDRTSPDRVGPDRIAVSRAEIGTARNHADTNILSVPIILNQTQPRAVHNSWSKLGLSKLGLSKLGLSKLGLSRLGLHFVPVAFAAMAAIMAGLLVQNRQLDGTLRALAASRDQLEFLLTSSQTRTVVLNSADGKAVVGVVLSASDGGLLISHTMGDLAGTKTWQAWYILKGETVPHSLGITKTSRLMIHVPVNAQVIAVSEEPAGGSQSPTTVRAIATL